MNFLDKNIIISNDIIMQYTIIYIIFYYRHLNLSLVDFTLWIL